MAIVNGKLFRMLVNGDVITMEESFDYDGSKETIEASNKDGDFVLSGTATETVNVTAHYDDDVAATNQFSAMYAIWKNGTTVPIVWGGQQNGDLTFEGNAVVTNVTFSAATGNTPAQWTATLNISGGLTAGTAST